MMDKKFLEGLGVTDADAVKQILAAYTAGIQAEKDATATIQTQLDEASRTIQSYKDMNIEGIQASVEEYKQKLEQSEADRKAFEYQTKLSGYVKGLRLKNDVYEKYVSDMLREKELKFDGDKLIGGDELVQEFRGSHADAFLPDKEERTGGSTGNHLPTGVSGVEAAFYAKNPDLAPEK